MLNLITDVPGVRVGNAEDAKAVTGVTAALFDDPVVASGVTRGGAPGSRDTTLLEPEMSVQGIDGVVLSGGSLFGLDAAGGVVSYLRTKNVGVRVGPLRIPVAVQAITFDLLNGGDKEWGRMPPYWELGWRAAESASGGVFALGSVGGGLGVTTATLKGGLGSASATVAGGFTVGALVVVNAVGTTTIGTSPHFWAAPYEVGVEFGGLGLSPSIAPDDLKLRLKGGGPPSTTIALVATDAVLTKAQAKRLAIMADDGIARAIRPAHAPMDGDTVFAVATQRLPLRDAMADLTALGAAAGDCLARSIARAVYEATNPGPPYKGPPAHRDMFLRR